MWLTRFADSEFRISAKYLTAYDKPADFAQEEEEASSGPRRFRRRYTRAMEQLHESFEMEYHFDRMMIAEEAANWTAD